MRPVLEEYARRDARVKVVFRETNGHISAASNSALELVTGSHLALLDHDDLLAEHALYIAAIAINDHPDADIFYSDEDKIDGEDRRTEPYFKPDFGFDLLLGQNYVSHLGVYRLDAVKSVGGFRLGFEGSQDYDLVLRILAKTKVRSSTCPGSSITGGCFPAPRPFPRPRSRRPRNRRERRFASISPARGWRPRSSRGCTPITGSCATSCRPGPRSR